MTKLLSLPPGARRLSSLTVSVGALLLAAWPLACDDGQPETGTAPTNPQPGCVGLTCADAAANCGQILDGCGNILECGTCAAGETCGAAGPNLCGVGTCDPYECSEAGLTCGLHADGCGTVWECGPTCDDGSVGTGGGTSTGGGNSGGGTSTGGGSGEEIVVSPLGEGVFQGEGAAQDNHFAEGTVIRDQDWYFIITNGWGGDRVYSSSINWLGTSFTVSMNGTEGGNYEPFGYPSVFCGNYSDKIDKTKCGLPKPINELTSLETGWQWAAGGNSSAYNAAWDVWIGDGTNLSSYLMVWLRDPPGHQPAGDYRQSVTVAGQSWDVWEGTVFGRPIVTFTKPEGQDVYEAEFDMLDFYEKSNELYPGKLTGTHINSVAIGFELWEQVSGLETVDFYVDPRPR